jgi:ankyrin repeat protein
MLNQDEQLESGTSEVPTQSEVSQGDVPSQKKKPEGEAESIESAESEKGQEPIKSEERINEITREDSLGSLAIFSDEVIFQILSSLDLKDSATVRFLNHLFYDLSFFIPAIEIRVQEWFPHDYYLLRQSKTPVNWFVELGKIYLRELGKFSPETFHNIIFLIEYFRVKQEVPVGYTFFEFISVYGEYSVSILEWLSRNGHQTLVDYIFTHHILGMFNENGYWDNKKINAIKPDFLYHNESRMLTSAWDLAVGCNQLAFMQQQLSDRKKKENLKQEIVSNINYGKNAPIDIAIRYRYFEMMKMLLQFIQESFPKKVIQTLSICKNLGGLSILHQAAAEGDVKFTLALLQFVLEISDGNLQTAVRDNSFAVFKCLHIAAVKGYFELLKEVITSLEAYYRSQEHDPKKEINNLLYDLQVGRTPYAWAAQFNHQEILQYLFEYDREAYSKALPSVIEHRNSISNEFSFVEDYKLFCLPQNSVEQNKQISDNYLEIFARLLAVGADVNTPDRDGITALHHAVKNKDVDAITYLINKAHANVNVIDSQGKTPLQYAYDIPVILHTLHNNNPDKELRRKIIDILSAKKEPENVPTPESQPEKNDRLFN